jgi:hypothetical protein
VVINPAKGSGACALLIVLFGLYYHLMPSRRSEIAEQTADVRKASEAFLESGLPAGELTHFNTPVTFQMHLGTYRSWTGIEKINRSIQRGETPLIAVMESDAAPERDELDGGL